MGDEFRLKFKFFTCTKNKHPLNSFGLNLEGTGYELNVDTVHGFIRNSVLLGLSFYGS